MHRGSLLLKLMRWIMFRPPAIIGYEQALLLARKACEENEFPWQEPVQVVERLNEWDICTPSNVAISIDIHDGRVLSIAMVLYQKVGGVIGKGAARGQ